MEGSSSSPRPPRNGEDRSAVDPSPRLGLTNRFFSIYGKWFGYNGGRNSTVASEAYIDGPYGPKSKAVGVDVTSTDEMEAVYRLHYTLLLYIAVRKFRVPASDAESLIQEVFLAYLSNSKGVRDIRSWLVGAMSNASRQYWRARGRTEPLPDDMSERSDPGSAGLADKVALKITVRETLSRLHEKCRETLRLHYFEGCSAPEVARELATTPRYAEKLIHKCLKRAHEIYLTLTAGKK